LDAAQVEQTEFCKTAGYAPIPFKIVWRGTSFSDLKLRNI